MYISTLTAVLAIVGRVTSTNFLNHGQLLANVEDRDWFERNVPFLDVPDQQIQEIYYFRWTTYKEHLVYTGAQYGYMPSEFLYPTVYGAPYGGIVAAAGHHINEGRWCRDPKYTQDTINYWLSGPGQFAKPATELLNKDTFDWAHQYSFWAASAVWNAYLVNGNRDFVIGQLDNLVKQYRGWDNHFISDLGLYWQIPVWDATEYTAAAYESSDAYHGGAGFRPTLNAYQYGDARAISAIAALKGDTALANDYRLRADALQNAMQIRLWDQGASFFKHRAKEDNPSGSLLSTREIMGYIPWIFNMPTQNSNIAAFAQLMDPQGFSSVFGPTTAERRSRWFMFESQQCCRWNGPSWPYATAQTLTAIENVLNNYPAQNYITSANYVTLLRRYAATQYKNGKPHIGEAHDPDSDRWIYDSTNGSEDYNHSTFVDNIIAGLIGLRAQPDSTLVVNPLAPSSWSHFALENVAYHGHTITILWDSTGSYYNNGRGLRVWVDDVLAGSRETLGSLRVNVGATSVPATSQLVNIAANGQNFPQLTTTFASYTYRDDRSSRINDGMIWRAGIPQNSRWTSYSSPNSQDHVGLDLRRSQSVNDVRIFFYDDGGGVRLPSSFDLQYWTGSTWTTVPNQQRSAVAVTSNAQTKITFPAIRTTQLRVVAPNRSGGVGWGVSEFEVWTRPIFQLRNENSGKLMAVENTSTANGAYVQQYDDVGSRDHLWEFLLQPGGWFKIKNVNSGLLLAVEVASTANSARLWQYEDNGTPDHLWRVVRIGNDGLFTIRNQNSGKVVGVDGMSTGNSANVVQFDDSGTRDHLWSLLPAVRP